jgi:hypothetical protein
MTRVRTRVAYAPGRGAHVRARRFDDQGAIVADQAHASGTTAGTLASGGPDMSRKQFLTAATLGVGGVMGALIAVPVAGMALAPIFGGRISRPSRSAT